MSETQAHAYTIRITNKSRSREKLAGGSVGFSRVGLVTAAATVATTAGAGAVAGAVNIVDAAQQSSVAVDSNRPIRESDSLFSGQLSGRPSVQPPD